eukprot:GHVN01002976.1.p2 GENE.GHVN01002976.1~~GHVN01002976.1.p2  ORF type:complete len:319 (-),score=83.25 GHVN01002976.1:1655-2581(-)
MAHQVSNQSVRSVNHPTPAQPQASLQGTHPSSHKRSLSHIEPTSVKREHERKATVASTPSSMGPVRKATPAGDHPSDATIPPLAPLNAKATKHTDYPVKVASAKTTTHPSATLSSIIDPPKKATDAPNPSPIVKRVSLTNPYQGSKVRVSWGPPLVFSYQTTSDPSTHDTPTSFSSPLHTTDKDISPVYSSPATATSPALYTPPSLSSPHATYGSPAHLMKQKGPVIQPSPSQRSSSVTPSSSPLTPPSTHHSPQPQQRVPSSMPKKTLTSLTSRNGPVPLAVKSSSRSASRSPPPSPPMSRPVSSAA